MVLDGGRFIRHTFTALRVPEPSAFVHTLNFGAIGLGMANAVGTYFGAPGRPVVMVAGNGGFMLGGLAEVGTAVRHGVDVVVFVMNDGAYGAEYIQFRNKNMEPAISTFNWPDLGRSPPPSAARASPSAISPTSRPRWPVGVEHRTVPMLVDIKLDLAVKPRTDPAQD